MDFAINTLYLQQKIIFMIKGVITGDIVDSSLIPNEWKSKISETLKKVVYDFRKQSSASFEMFRGDSFQIVVEKPSSALAIGIALRAALRTNTPDGLPTWDARISIGIGDVSYESESIVTSDGEAFRLSGREFDALGKRRIAISTTHEGLNAELKLNTAFADEIITKWTPKQAEVVYVGLIEDALQKDMAESLGMKLSNFNKHWNLAHGGLILLYIDRFEDLINNIYTL